MFLVINFCENNNISINHSRNTSSSNFSSNQIKHNNNINNNNNNFSFSMNLKQLNNYSNKSNININYGKMGGFENFDQTRNKYSLKFFEKLNFNTNKNNKSLKITNVNEIINPLNKNKQINANKEIIQIYNKDKNNLKNKNNEKISINIIKTKKENDIENNNLSSSYSNLNNINSMIGTNNNPFEYNKGAKLINDNYRTIDLERKFSENKKKTKLSKVKIEKITRNISNPTIVNNNNQLYKKKINIDSSPVYKNEQFYNTSDKSPIILKKINNENNNDNDNDKENENNIISDTKKLSIIDIPAPSCNNNSNNRTNTDRIYNNKIKILNVLNNNTNLTSKERALYILLNSSILPLTSQFILSRSSNNIRNIVLKKDILLNYQLYLISKIRDYEEKQLSYNEKIKSVFNPTKIAEITLNFITTQSEKMFNEHYVLLSNNKNDNNFIYYKNYVKIIYYIINEKLEDENKLEISENRLLTNLYNILNKKGYNNIKDYLYFIFISNNNTHKENIFMNNIDKINEIIQNEAPKLLCFDESLKMCRFIAYSLYLIKEIIDYANLIKKTIKIKIEEEELIQNMKSILHKYNNKYLN